MALNRRDAVYMTQRTGRPIYMTKFMLLKLMSQSTSEMDVARRCRASSYLSKSAILVISIHAGSVLGRSATIQCPFTDNQGGGHAHHRRGAPATGPLERTVRAFFLTHARTAEMQGLCDVVQVSHPASLTPPGVLHVFRTGRATVMGHPWGHPVAAASLSIQPNSSYGMPHPHGRNCRPVALQGDYSIPARQETRISWRRPPFHAPESTGLHTREPAASTRPHPA